MQAGQALRTAADTVSPGPTWMVAGTVAAVVVGSGGLNAAAAAALISIAGALATVVAAWQQRRISAAVVTGAAGTVLADLTVLNVHMSPAVSSAVLTAVSVVVGALMHLAVVHQHEAPPAPVTPPGPVVAPPPAPASTGTHVAVQPPQEPS